MVPVDPGLAEQALHAQRVVAGLDEAGPLDMVDIVGDPADVPPVVAAAIHLRAWTAWMRLGIVAPASAAARAGATLTGVPGPPTL